MSTIPIIDPNAVFTLASLRQVLGLREGSLPREVRQKRLRARKRCGKYFFLGRDVLAWLEGEQTEGARDRGAATNGARRSG
jgi:hypothetical protein